MAANFCRPGHAGEHASEGSGDGLAEAGLANARPTQEAEDWALAFRVTSDLVTVADVAICSPSQPHEQHLRKCEVQFVGLNARYFDWTYCGRNPREMTGEYWRYLKPAVVAKVL